MAVAKPEAATSVLKRKKHACDLAKPLDNHNKDMQANSEHPHAKTALPREHGNPDTTRPATTAYTA